MANELRHSDVGTALSKSEWEAIGGHIFNSQAAGDIMYASTTSQLTRLGIGTANQVLATNSGATAPEWVSSVASATLAATVTVIDSTDTSSYIAMFDSATGSLAAKTDAGITYNAGTGMLTATGFTGPLTGTLQTASQTNITAVGTIATGVWQGTAIASGYIAGDAITGAKIADDAIDSEHYTDGSIDTAHIADNQVTLAKMAGLVRGKIIYGDSSGDPAALTVGSSGQYLTSDGTDISWGSISSAAVTAVNNATADELVTIGSTTTELDAEANLTYASDVLTTASSSASLPRIDITNTHAGATAGEIRFNKDSASGDDNDVMGKISWYGTDAGEATHEELAYIDAIITDSAAGSEAASMRFYVAENDATRTLGLQLAGQADADGEIDVTIGAGAASTATIAGTLTMGTTAALTNGGLVAVANQSNITGVGTITSGTWQGTTVAVDQGGTGATSLSNLITLTTHTSGNYVATITGGTGITSSAGTTGEGTTHSLSVDASQTQITAVGTIATGVWQGTAVAQAYIADNSISLAKMAGGTDGNIISYDASGDPVAIATGNDGQVLTSAGAGQPPAFEDAGGGGGTIELTAIEDIAAGAPVALFNDSGTVKATNIKGLSADCTVAGINGASGPSPTVHVMNMSPAMSRFVWMAGESKWAHVMVPNAENTAGYTNYHPLVRVGTFSKAAQTMTWGDWVVVDANTHDGVVAVWDPDTSRLVVLCSGKSSNTQKAFVYEIASSGNTVVTADGGGEYGPGTALAYENGNATATNLCAVYDENSNKVIVGYEDRDDSEYGKLCGLTITGGSTNTAAAFGAGTKFNGDSALYTMEMAFDQDNGIGFIMFGDNGDNNYTKAVAFTHDGSTFTIGSVVEIFGANLESTHYSSRGTAGKNLVWQSAGDSFVACLNVLDSDSDYTLTAVSCSVSGTTITAGTPIYPLGQNMYVGLTDVYTWTGDAESAALSSQNGKVGIEYDPDADRVIGVTRIEGDILDLEAGIIEQRDDAFQFFSLAITGTGDRTLTATVHTSDSGRKISRPRQLLGGGNMQVRHPVLHYDPNNNIMMFSYNAAYSQQQGGFHYVDPTFCFFNEGAEGDATTYAKTYAPSNMDHFAGFNTAGVSATNAATITVVGGINENQNSLTAGVKYYIDDGGLLKTRKPMLGCYLYDAGITTASTKLYVRDLQPYHDFANVDGPENA